MNRSECTIYKTDLQHLLRQAAAESVVATASYCVARSTGASPDQHGAPHLEEELAWIAARVTERGWSFLPVDATDARAPIAWAVQEMIEWAEHVTRYQALGDDGCRVPLTWLPRGPHPLGNCDVVAAVEERLELLRAELVEHGVAVADAPPVGAAA
jgi:hypothetical protein